jgi:hypothetical protein
MACPASASTSSIILSIDLPFASHSRRSLFSSHFVLSTIMHKFAQTFFPISIDAENGKVYLPPQIEPEA